MVGPAFPLIGARRRAVHIASLDLADGETLQMSGSCNESMFGHLQLVAEVGDHRVESSVEMLSAGGRRRSFHVWSDLRPLLDTPTGDIRVRFESLGRACRVVWAADAFGRPNRDVVHPVAPDLERGVWCSVVPPGRSTDLLVRRTPLEPRLSLRSIRLGTTCEVRVSAPFDVDRLGWSDDDTFVGAERTGEVWTWADLSVVARPGVRWTLVGEDSDERRWPVCAPLGDLVHPGAARVFPSTVVTVDGRSVRLVAAADRRDCIVLRCRAVDDDTGSGSGSGGEPGSDATSGTASDMRSDTVTP